LTRRPLRTASLSSTCRDVKKFFRPPMGEPDEFRRDGIDDGLAAVVGCAPFGGFWCTDALDEVLLISI
jgi:hypothetical protein